MSDDDGAEYGLVMPFVVCASRGGPYDDAAFVAGYEMGQLAEHLRVAAAIGVMEYRATLREASKPQVDLIAMQHDWVVERWNDEFPEWGVVTFKRSGLATEGTDTHHE